MSLYECVLIARNDVTQQQVDGIVDGITRQLETDGGTMVKREYWGLRGLAYRIKKNRKGHYVLMTVTLEDRSLLPDLTAAVPVRCHAKTRPWIPHRAQCPRTCDPRFWASDQGIMGGSIGWRNEPASREARRVLLSE